MMILTLTERDSTWHGRFFAFVDRIFGGLDFVTWAGFGGWRPDYEVFALAEGETILATVGRMRMRLLLAGQETEGFQLGAVASDPAWRGRGLARRLLQRAMAPAEVGDRPVFLFANERVTGFYPRFGFRRLPQQRFEAEAALRPAGPPLRPFRIEVAAERARLARLCAVAPAQGAFTARDYYPALLWHLVNGSLEARWLEAPEAFLVLSREPGRLLLHGCLAARPFPLAPVLAGAGADLRAPPLERIAFGFSPEGWWPAAELLVADDRETRLFVTGGCPSPSRPFRFPDLAQT